MQLSPGAILPNGDTRDVEEDLGRLLNEKRRRHANRARLRKAAAIVVFIVAPLGYLLAWASPLDWRADLRVGLLLLIVLGLVLNILSWRGSRLVRNLDVFSWFSSPAGLDWDIRDLELKLELGKSGSDAARSALWLFKSNENELLRYYTLALRHSRIVLWLGVFAILVGLLIVSGTIWFLIASAKEGANIKAVQTMVVGALGAIGGILSNYVAAMYIKMHSATSQALNDFHSRFVTTHHVHFGNYLAALIGVDDPRSDTLSDMARSLSKR
ncbi:MAG TPA: hypothetical protein QGG47_07105 [Acidobacteriota bacterium]|nr:hypothetical protein [Acidobacteriota bacterium]